jgi:hypothetical protein
MAAKSVISAMASALPATTTQAISTILTLDVAIGEYDNFGGPSQDYQFYSLTAEHKGFYGKYGTFDDQFDGAYVEAGYATTLSGIDVTFFGLYADENLIGEEEHALVLTVGKSFGF